MSEQAALKTKTDPIVQDAAGSVHVIAVGGGKGGVGKSFVSSTMALFLASLNRRTVLVDLDLGASNSHTVLGELKPTKTLHSFVSGTLPSIAEVIHITKFQNLGLISGASDPVDMANLNEIQRARILSSIHTLPADCVVLDLSAGTHQSTLDFFLLAHTKVVVLTPDPSSIENAYRFMKAAFFRRLKRFERIYNVEQTLNTIMDQQEELKIKTPAELLSELQRREPITSIPLIEAMKQLEFSIILNQSRMSKDSELGLSVQSVARRYFGVPVNFLGSVDYDNAVWQALRKKRPVIYDNAYSNVFAQLLAMSRNLANAKPHHK